jgi:pimeloyl-ACP methyl ester carboxylesterase
MSTFLIVHGGWGGGWEWTPVAQMLRARGHQVFTPTLTGLGERSHLGSDIDLEDHIEDVAAVFTFEELRDVVLCGHSAGGMVVTGVADRLPDRVQLLVYLDAFVPADGEALHDLIPHEFGNMLLQAAQARGDNKIPYPAELQPPEGLIREEVRTSYIRRTRPHPAATQTTQIRLTGAVNMVRRAFVRCTGEIEPDNDLLGSFAERARAEGWLYREIGTPHDLHLFDPEGTSTILHDLATSAE